MSLTEVAGLAAEWWNDAQWHYVSSSNVTAFRYERATRILEMNFHGNRLYRYRNIPEGMAQELAEAPSPGGWWHANLKGAPFEKI